jgi:DNA-binding beta-propeller fold protein YncE
VVATSAGGTTYGADQTFSTAPKVYLSGFGSKGTTEGKFEGPRDSATDDHGDVWVTDYSNSRIEEFSPAGKFLRACGSKGSGEGQFNEPTGIAVNPTSNQYRGGYVYVSDSGNNRIEVVSPECKSVETIGKTGSENGQLSGPMGLAFGINLKSGRDVLAVADSRTNPIEEFISEKCAVENGEIVAGYGSKGTGEGQFRPTTSSLGSRAKLPTAMTSGCRLK